LQYQWLYFFLEPSRENSCEAQSGYGEISFLVLNSHWLPDLVKAVIDWGREGKLDTEWLHASLCAIELAQGAVHPVLATLLIRRSEGDFRREIRQTVRIDR
jgi:hypothetical protein